MKIKVTQEMIDKAEQSRSDTNRICEICPLALALSAAFGCSIQVGITRFTPKHESNYKTLPENALRLRRAFDHNQPVSPIEFEVEEL